MTGRYARAIDPLVIAASVAVVALVALPVVGLGRIAWRIWRHNEEMQSGGSLSDQMFGRTSDRRLAEKDPD